MSKNSFILSALKFSLDLDFFNAYFTYKLHDHGFIDDLSSFYDKLDEFYDFKAERNKNYESNIGACSTYMTGLNVNIHFGIKNLGDKVLNLFIKGHEETHVLENMCALKYLSAHFKKQKGLFIPVHIFPESSSELVANIGGFFALDQEGYTINDLLFKDFILSSSDIWANRIYNSAKYISKIKNS